MMSGSTDLLHLTSDKDLSPKIESIELCSMLISNEFAASILYAYIACLSANDLSRATLYFLEADKVVFGAIRKRLIKIGQEGVNSSELDQLGVVLMALPIAGRRVSTRTDSVLSAIYPFLSVETRKSTLDRWIDRGNKSSAARWLKAMRNDPFLLDVELAWNEWQFRHDSLSAKIFIEHASDYRLADAFPDLISNTSEGWVVSKAALKLGQISEDCWGLIRQKFPATYAYLCVKLNRSLTAKEAISIVEETTSDPFGNRGLAIWSIGQMKMTTVLDDLLLRYDEFRERDIEVILQRDR